MTLPIKPLKEVVRNTACQSRQWDAALERFRHYCCERATSGWFCKAHSIQFKKP